MPPTFCLETPQAEMSKIVRLCLEATRLAAAKVLEHYRRMEIEVTPQMTLASPPAKEPPETSTAR